MSLFDSYMAGESTKSSKSTKTKAKRNLFDEYMSTPPAEDADITVPTSATKVGPMAKDVVGKTQGLGDLISDEVRPPVPQPHDPIILPPFDPSTSHLDLKGGTGLVQNERTKPAPVEQKKELTILPPMDTNAGHIDLRGGEGWVPDRRTRAVFTDQPNAGFLGKGLTGKELGEIKKDRTREEGQAFVGGVLNTATMRFGDELSALAESLATDRKYTDIRGENRSAFKAAKEGSPKYDLLGNLLGAGLSAGMVPGLAPKAGTSMLSAINLGKAAGASGLVGLGESEADLTKGEVGGSVWDATLGAFVGAGTGAALGGLGKAYKGIVGAPERVAGRADKELVQGILGAATGKERAAVFGEMGREKIDVLNLVKGKPEIEKAIRAKKYDQAVDLIRADRDMSAVAKNATIEDLQESRKLAEKSLEIPEKIPYVYHSTKLDKLSSIKENGLTPFGPFKWSEDPWPGGGTDPRVYFGTKPQEAWIHGRASSGKGGVAVLRTTMDPDFKEAPKLKGALMTNRNVAPEKLEIYTNDGWIPVKSWDGENLPKTPPIGREFKELPITSRATGNIKLDEGLLKLERFRNKIASNPAPEAQAEAAKLDKIIEGVKEKWIPAEPPPIPKGGELLGKLVEGANSEDKKKILLSSGNLLKNEAELAKIANDPVAVSNWVDSQPGLNKWLDESIDIKKEVSKLAQRRNKIASNPAPEAQAEAAKLDKIIEGVKEKWIPAEPPPIPKGGELLGKLVEGAKKYDVDRASHNADDWLKIAKKYKLDKVSLDPSARSGSIQASMDKLNKANDFIYEKSVTKNPIYVANLVGSMKERADALRKEYASGSFAKVFDDFADDIARTASLRREIEIDPRELRRIITSKQGKAFSGKFANPKDAEEAWQEVTSTMRDFLEGHVEKNTGKGVLAQLKKNNKEISILKPLKDAAEAEAATFRLKASPLHETRTGTANRRDLLALGHSYGVDIDDKYSVMLALKRAAEKRASESKLLPSPLHETRTGTVSVSDMMSLIEKTENPEAKRVLTDALYKQIGKRYSKALAAFDRSEELRGRIEAPLVKSATKAAVPTQYGALDQGDWRKSARSRLMAILDKSSALGSRVANRVDDGAAKMVNLARKGANVRALRIAGKMSGVPKDIAENLISILLPRKAAEYSVTYRSK